MERSQSVTSESCTVPSENNSCDTDSFLDTSNDHPKEKDADMEDAQRTGVPVQEVFVPATSELQHGYRILRELMADGNKSVNWAFMDAVDSDAYGLHDYYERVKQPMWLCRSKYFIVSLDIILRSICDIWYREFEAGVRLIPPKIRVASLTFSVCDGMEGFPGFGIPSFRDSPHLHKVDKTSSFFRHH